MDSEARTGNWQSSHHRPHQSALYLPRAFCCCHAVISAHSKQACPAHHWRQLNSTLPSQCVVTMNYATHNGFPLPQSTRHQSTPCAGRVTTLHIFSESQHSQRVNHLTKTDTGGKNQPTRQTAATQNHFQVQGQSKITLPCTLKQSH